jgi:hypothetical protein
MPLRDLTAAEHLLLEFLLTPPFPARDALALQAETVRTGGSSCDCGCPSFSLVPDRSLPPAELPEDSRVVSEANGHDPGGNCVHVILWVDAGGYLADVEVSDLHADSTFAGVPDPSALRISVWSEPDESGVQTLLSE